MVLCYLSCNCFLESVFTIDKLIYLLLFTTSYFFLNNNHQNPQLNMSCCHSRFCATSAPYVTNISFCHLKRTVRLRAVLCRNSKTGLPNKVERSGKASNQVGVSLLCHLPDGGLADEDQEDEEPSQHVQAPNDSKRQLEK